MTRLEFSSPKAYTARRIGQILTFLSLLSLSGYAWLLLNGYTQWQMQGIFVVLILNLIASLFCIQFSLNGRHEIGIHILLASIYLAAITGSLLLENLGSAIAIAVVTIALATATATLPQRQTTPIFILSLTVALFTTAMDIAKIPWRLSIPGLQEYTSTISIVTSIIFGLFLLRQFPQYPLTNKLLVGFIGLAVITSVGQSTLMLRNLRQVITSGTRQALLGVAQQVSADIERYLDSNLATVQAAADVPLLAQYLQMPKGDRPITPLDSDVNQFLRNLRGADLQNISGYMLLDADGQVVKDTTGYMYPYSANITFDQRDFFTQPRDTGIAYISQPQFSIKPNPATPYLYLSAPIVNPRNGDFLGVIVARYRTDALQARIEAFNDRLGTHSFAALYAPLEGNYIHLAHGTRPELALALLGPETPTRLVSLQNRGYLSLRYMQTVSVESPELLTAIANANTASFFTVPEDYAPLPVESEDNPTDENYQAVALPLESVDWKVAYYQLETSFSSTLIPQIRNNQFVGLITIVLATIGAILFTQVISRPINRLAQVAQTLSTGDLTARAEISSEDKIGQLAGAFNQMAEQLSTTLSSMERQITERTTAFERRNAQIQAAAEVGRIANQIRDLERLLPQVAELISQRFGFYHVGIFLLDARGEYAVLQASNSLGGQRMLARGHKLKVGQVGIVGYVTAQRQPRIALDVGEDAVFFNNPDLPNTRSEMAIPLITGEEVLGALDVQSTQPNAFSHEDVEVMQLLADQIAIAISNAQLFARNEKALEDIRRAYGEVAQRAWLNLLTSRRALAYAQIQDKTLPVEPMWDEVSQQALQEKRPLASDVPDENGRFRLTLPVYSSGVPLGTITAFKEGASWLETEIELLGNIVQELGITLESSRLFEEGQRRAQLERASAQVVTHLRETLDVQAMLRTAAEEIRRSLELPEVSVRLTPHARETAGNENGNSQDV